jgi:hypothetical protein
MGQDWNGRRPTTAQGFITFMQRVWEHAPGELLYDDWHDAVTTALRCGMVRTGTGRRGIRVYRFPGAPDGVLITGDGASIESTQRRFGRRTKGAIQS